MRIPKNTIRPMIPLSIFPALGILFISCLMLGQAATVYAEGNATGDGVPSPYRATNGLSGEVTIAGSDTMRPLVMRLAAEFSRLHRAVRFTVEGGGSSGAIREFVMGLSQQRRADKARSGHEGTGRVGLVASSRPLSSGEMKAFSSQHGYEPIGFPIAVDAVVLYINPQNPIQGLTLDQVAAIFGKGDLKSGAKIATWGQLGLRDEWEHRTIRLYGRDKKSGTREFFLQHVLHGGPEDPDILEQPGSATEILAIARDSHAIGYAGAGFQTTLVRLVALAGKEGEPFITPTTDMVTQGTYPLTRYLYLYIDKDPQQGIEPIIHEFLTFCNSAAGQAIVTKAGSYQLSDSQLLRNAAFLKGESATALGDAKEDSRLSVAKGTSEAETVGRQAPKED